MFMFSRTETESKIIYVQKPYMYYLILGYFVCSVLTRYYPDLGVISILNLLVFLLFFIHIVISLKGIFKAMFEIRREMKFGAVSISGSKLSFKDPITYTIKK